MHGNIQKKSTGIGFRHLLTSHGATQCDKPCAINALPHIVKGLTLHLHIEQDRVCNESSNCVRDDNIRPGGFVEEMQGHDGLVNPRLNPDE
jgi:hypothetical protein